MVSELEFIQIQSNSEEKYYCKMAKVVALFENKTAKLQFYGEETPSEKEYSYLEIYKNPSIGDIVLTLYFNDTYIILGKVVYGTAVEDNLITIDQLNTILNDYVTGDMLNDYVTANTLSNTLSSYSSIGHKHDRLYEGSDEVGFRVHTSTVSHFTPNSSNISCGYNLTNYRWKEICAASSTIVTSDARYKKDIEILPSIYKELLKQCMPVIFKFTDGTSNRYHVGFVAQEVESVMNSLGMDTKDFAGLIKTPKTDNDGKETEDYEYALRYEEFIGLNIAVTQDNLKEIITLKNTVEKQQEIIKNLVERIEKLEGGA